MHNLAVAEAGVNRAHEGMNESFEVLGANRRQSDNSYATVLASFKREITPAVCGDLMTHFGEPCTGFLITGFDSAVFTDYASATNECNAQLLRFAWPNFDVWKRS